MFLEYWALYFFGVRPVNFLKVAIKWLWEEKLRKENMLKDGTFASDFHDYFVEGGG